VVWRLARLPTRAPRTPRGSWSHGSSHGSLPGSSLSDRSPSYQAGYTSGESGGTARSFLVEAGNVTNGSDAAADSACSVALTPAQIINPSLVETEYKQGCHDAHRDHPVMGGVNGGPSR
jgi:hypothetical protein